MTKMRLLISTMALFALALAPLGVGANSNTEVVTPNDLSEPDYSVPLEDGSWYFKDDTNNTVTDTEQAGDFEFVTGPSNPPEGVGSIRFNVENDERWTMTTNQFAGTELSDLTDIGFSTYQPEDNPGNPERAVFFNFDVDFDNTAEQGYQGRLVFVPRDNGTVQQDEWQSWDAVDNGTAQWRWSGYGGNGNQWPDGETDALRSWNEITAAFTDAEVYAESFTGEWVFRAGEPYPNGFTGYLDAAEVGVGSDSTTYDFEPVLSPEAKEDCKDGGWANMNSPRQFKNQGDCVSYVASNGRVDENRSDRNLDKPELDNDDSMADIANSLIPSFLR